MSGRNVTLGLSAFLLVAGLAGCGKTETSDQSKAAEASPGVHLEADDIQSMGLATTPAAAAQYVPQQAGFGVVTGLDAVAEADSGMASAEAAAGQSAAAARRARELSTGAEAAVSREQLDLAEAKAASDQAALVLARRKADAVFGVGSPWRDARSRARIMAALGSGKTVLVRATFPLGVVAKKPESLTVTPLGGSGSYAASEIWDAPADPAIPGRSFFLLVRGSNLAQGQRVTVTASAGQAISGVRIPASAMVLSESEPWAYVETKPGTFLRQPLDITRPVPGGYFEPAGQGFSPGQPIVSHGAGLLLAHETNPSSEADD